jgi:hypothetical protein
MLMVYMDQEEFVAMDPGEGAGTEPMSWDREMEARGVRRSGSLLRPAADATTVRVSGEEVLLSDGPFAEAKEQIARFHQSVPHRVPAGSAPASASASAKPSDHTAGGYRASNEGDADGS